MKSKEDYKLSDGENAGYDDKGFDFSSLHPNIGVEVSWIPIRTEYE